MKTKKKHRNEKRAIEENVLMCSKTGSWSERACPVPSALAWSSQPQRASLNLDAKTKNNLGIEARPAATSKGKTIRASVSDSKALGQENVPAQM